MSSFTIKQNDTRPYLDAQLLDAASNPIDLTGSTVRFLMSSASGGNPVVDASCTILDAAAGRVRYAWQPGDTANYGSYRGEFEITFGDGTRQTVPNTGYIAISIVRDIG